MAYENRTTNHVFLKFVAEALVPSLYRGDIVVMDNLKSHYAVGLREAIEAVGAMVLYLPRYTRQSLIRSSTHGPKIKAMLRRAEARTLRDFRIKSFGWFTHRGYSTRLKAAVSRTKAPMEKLSCPVLILHAEQDENAPFSQAYLLRDRLSALRKESEIEVLPGQGHALRREDVNRLGLSFFERSA
jgi:pimeloyl-ACP methyl ester carboxylesterase